MPSLLEAFFRKRMTRELFIKFIQNQCTSVDLNKVRELSNSGEVSDEFWNLALHDWNEYKEDPCLNDEKFSRIFDTIQQKIDLKNGKLQKNKFSRSVSSQFVLWLTRAAAILLFPVVAMLLYTLSQNKMAAGRFEQYAADTLEISSPIGSRTIVFLSDGSAVHLNYGSKLKYPQVFAGNKREVSLWGEGYFEVAHNPEKPFVVNAGKLFVTAKGTTFNINAYPEKENIETTLVEGNVVLEKVVPGHNKVSLGSMMPGQHVVFNTKTNDVNSHTGNLNKYIAWKDGKTVFVDDPIKVVTEKLSRMFNVNIEVKENVTDYLYTFTFVDEPLYQILDLMTIATPVKYKIYPRKRLPDGSFAMQKIVIEKK